MTHGVTLQDNKTFQPQECCPGGREGWWQMKCYVSVPGHWPSLLTLAWGFRFGGPCFVAVAALVVRGWGFHCCRVWMKYSGGRSGR